ncbi:hypothetical protein [Paenibacillus tyrfis]|uniref:hypothetical protein n=1 Tax=Paenibacillus tyrfis TaxID=1501230 RepID=UPI000B58CF41|nr:hypothetical protein [Paenibacillus tyrfis]
MTPDIVIIVVAVLLVWLYRNRDKATGEMKFPKWLWNAAGIFILYIIIRNFWEVFDFTTNEADAWWPIVKKNAHNMMEGLRNFVIKISEPSGKGG